MVTTVMGRYLRDMASDTAQDHYPGRPIRPLPKRRLRERLSPEAADKIVYPPSAPAMSPLFFYPYNTKPEDERAQRQHPTDRARQEEIEHNYISRRNTKEVDSDEDYTELAYRSRYARRHSPYPSGLSLGRSYRYSQKQEGAHEKPPAPASTTSSADGYDSFENTNNKKKRKIPTPGDAISNGILLQNDLTSLGISGSSEEAAMTERGGGGDGQLYRPLAIASGGALLSSGRERLARIGGGRSSFRSLASDPNSGASTSKQAPASEPEPAGIISTAISKAENYTKEHSNQAGYKPSGSLLDAAAAQKPNPTAAQFTFTCDSQVPGSVPWPARPLLSTRNMGAAQSSLRPGPPHAIGASLASPGPPGPRRRDSSSSRQTPKVKPAAVPKKRRPSGREYLIAARERRERQELQNLHHPPSPEDMWICEFCEYERIFGTPPVALIRQYEIKDRRIRKQEAERRRLLEKAKMKGRKSKKGPKPTVKSAAPCQGSTRSRQNSSAHDTARPSHDHRSEGRASNSCSEIDDPGDPEEEFIDDNDAPPLVHRMTQTKPLPTGSNSRPKASAVQGGTGSSERLVS